MALIFHLAATDEWDAAQQTGSYRMSTRDESLDDGAPFIHCSWPHQVGGTANKHYADWPYPLHLLVIDTGRLVSAVCDEDLTGSGVSFPHIYGPLNLDAVIEVRAYERGADGRWPEVPAQALS